MICISIHACRKSALWDYASFKVLVLNCMIFKVWYALTGTFGKDFPLLPQHNNRHWNQSGIYDTHVYTINYSLNITRLFRLSYHGSILLKTETAGQTLVFVSRNYIHRPYNICVCVNKRFLTSVMHKQKSHYLSASLCSSVSMIWLHWLSYCTDSYLCSLGWVKTLLGNTWSLSLTLMGSLQKSCWKWLSHRVCPHI